VKKYQVTLPNGETLSYYEQGDSKETLLLIHGNTSSAIFFEPLIKTLPKSVSVIALDLRGFGESTYQKPIDSLFDFAEDIKLFLDSLGIDCVSLLGWSLGGAIAMEFAANYPNMVSNLMLLSSGSPKGYPVFKKDDKGQPIISEVYTSKKDMALDPVQVIPLLNIYETKNIDMLATIYDMAIYTGSKKPNKDDNLKWMEKAVLQRNLVDVDWALANFNISNEPSLYSAGNDKLKNIKAKTLIIWGDKDITVPKMMFDETVRLLPNAEVIIYKDAGHSIIVDETEKLAIDIIHFIS